MEFYNLLMNMKDLPEIRCDDVLQITPASHNQAKQMKGMGLFEHFLEADKVFEEFNYPMTLAIVAEGIEHYPEWVEYLKKHKDRYVFELHGLRHVNHSRHSVNQLRRDLETAKNMIEETFGGKVTTWYQPWGRKGENDRMDEACKVIGIKAYHQVGKVDAKIWLYNDKKGRDNLEHVNFHYWYPPQREHVRTVIERVCQTQDKN